MLLISVSSEVSHSLTPLSATVTGRLKPTSSPSFEIMDSAKPGLLLSSRIARAKKKEGNPFQVWPQERKRNKALTQ